MATTVTSRAYSFCNGRLLISGEIVPILYYPDTDEVWMRTKQIHTFTGATKIGQTLDRVDEVDKCLLQELIRRKEMPPMGGLLNNPPPNPDDYNEGKAIYVNQPRFYSIVLGSNAFDALAKCIFLRRPPKPKRPSLPHSCTLASCARSAQP
jgi:hypothetical protein